MKNIASSFTLPNGSVLKNRIAKSAMSENFGTRHHAPSKGLINAYRVWVKGRWNSIEFVVVSYKNENSAFTVKFLFKKHE